jgi:hypothetical protein
MREAFQGVWLFQVVNQAIPLVFPGDPAYESQVSSGLLSFFLHLVLICLKVQL